LGDHWDYDKVSSQRLEMMMGFGVRLESIGITSEVHYIESLESTSMATTKVTTTLGEPPSYLGGGSSLTLLYATKVNSRNK
jgi:hypothetical protein